MATIDTLGASAPASSLILGKHPEDIHSIIQTANEALSWFDHLFREIKKQAEFDHDDRHASLATKLTTIATLSGMGAHLSFDIGQYVNMEDKEMESALNKSESQRQRAARELL
ncbi:MAG: hypothetical protein LBK55_08435 [Azoarcus sp.]|jgi:hypothetical protein|nr:hypothetical protein [Azoarcus sp.]